MTSSSRAFLLRSRRGVLVLGFLAAGGIAVGWFIVPTHARTFAFVHALLDPVCIAIVCVSSLYHQVKHSRWLVPLLVVAVMLNVVSRPHDIVLTTIGFAAGGLAILATVANRKLAAIVATLLCGSAIAATLLTGLLRHI
jgi:hypothetical protein